MDDVQHTCTLELAKHGRESSRSWKSWARSGVVDKGGSRAHKYCRANVRHEEDTFWISEAGGGERLKVISAVWKKIWNEHSESIDTEPQGEALEPITAAQVLRAVHEVGAAKATGVDWHARHLLQMGENMVGRFADMLNLFEHGMHPPTDVNSITLIPKPDGGLRPIGLTPLFFRVWGRVRADYCKRFMNNVPYESVTGVSWKTCTRAAYESQFRIKHDVLIQLAKETGFPVRLAWAAARLYRAPRVVRYGLFASEHIFVKGGVIAGCSIAMALAALYMLRIHEDLIIQTAVERMILAENIVVRRLDVLSLPLNQKKSQVVCSSVAIRRRLSARWVGKEYEWVSQTRNLGGQLAVGLRRRTVVRQGRLRKSATWIKRGQRARHLRNGGASIAGLVRAGVVQAVGYLRVHPDGDACNPERRHHMAVIESWAFNVWMRRFKMDEVDRDLHRAARRLVKAKRPAYVVCMALGWEVISACEVKDHYGISHDMRKRSPAFMKSLAKDASRSCIDASFRARRRLQGRSSWWSPIDAARRKMKGNREKAAVFANLASGCCWTASTLYKRGLSPMARCELCGADNGTYAHRLLHCSGLARYRQNLKDNIVGYLHQLSKEGILEEQLWTPVWPDMISVYTDDAPALHRPPGEVRWTHLHGWIVNCSA
eukprot:5610666-Amphidinium_carterae.2